LATIDFTAASVDLASDQIYLPSHGFHTGSGPVQLTTTGVLPTGLAAVTNYFVIRVDGHRVKLATSLVNANAGTAVNLTALGSGVHTATYVNTFAPGDTADSIVTIDGHGLLDGDGPFQLTTSDADLPNGLLLATDYWVIRRDANNFYFADSYADAIAGAAIWAAEGDPIAYVATFSDGGTGTHTITRATASGVQSLVGDESAFWAHRLHTADGPFRLSTGGALPTGLSAATDYWAIKSSADAVQWASTKANAIAGTEINLTAAGSGTFVATATSDAVLRWLSRGRKISELKAID